jgi:hypothetical protein
LIEARRITPNIGNDEEEGGQEGSPPQLEMYEEVEISKFHERVCSRL